MRKTHAYIFAILTVFTIIVCGKAFSEFITSEKGTEIISDNNQVNQNIIHLDNFVQGLDYYYDFEDGYTKIKKERTLISKNKIDISNTRRLFFQYYGAPSKNVLLIYCYNQNEYLGYVSTRLDFGNSTYTFSLPYGTDSIHLYSNGNNKPVDFFLSEVPLNESLISKTKESLAGKRIVNFGDSIFGNTRPPRDISTRIAEITGSDIFNIGFGGCRMSENDQNWDAFSMCRLAESICSKDFRYQENVAISSVTGMHSYFSETLALLKSIDFNEIDIITIAYGTNDFTAGVSIDSDIYNDTTTFCGALRYTIELINSTYPNITIFILGPTYRFWMSESGEIIDDSDSRIINGVTLIDYIEAERKCANLYHCKFIDNYLELGINKNNAKFYFLENDGTHHNDKGLDLIARHISSELY